MKIKLIIILLFTYFNNSQAEVIHWLSQAESESGALINGDIISPKISSNGRYISFISHATNLVLNDTNRFIDLFVKDLQTSQIVRVYTTETDQQITDYGVINFSAPTSDGQWIAFSSYSEQLPSGQGFGHEFLYLKNIQTGVVINHSDLGNGSFFTVDDSIYLADDGQSITFIAEDPELINPNVSYFYEQIFRKHLPTQTFELISMAENGIDGANDFSIELGDVSDNGRYVVFSSQADNLTPDILNNIGDNIYLRDTQNNTTVLINRTPNGDSSADTDYLINLMSVSNAKQVVFITSQDDLVNNDNNNQDDIFLSDQGVISRINLSPTGLELHDSGPSFPTISADGTTVFFRDSSISLTTTVIEDDYSDLFKYDTNTRRINQITIGTDGTGANNGTFTQTSISTDGSRVVFNSSATNLVNEPVSQSADSLYIFNNNNQQLQHLSQAAFDPMTSDNNSNFASVSSDQLTVIYSSDASNLTPVVIPTATNVYLLNRQTNQHQIIGRKLASYITALSPSGRYALFSSNYFQPLAEVDLGARYLFLYDHFTGNYTQIEEGSSYNANVNDQGLVVFATHKSLDANDLNETLDVYLYTPNTGNISLVSKNISNIAVGGNFPDIGGSGHNTWLAFSSDSDELVIIDTNDLTDVFIQNWPNGPIIRTSATVAGVEGNGASFAPKISADGNHILFNSEATNLTTHDYSQADEDQLFLYNRINQSIQLVTINDNGLPIYDHTPSIWVFDISDSGRYVVYEYEDDADPIMPDFTGDTDGVKDIILFDQDTQTNQVISRYIGGTNSNNLSQHPKVAEDLSHNPPLLGVVFESLGGDLTGRPDHPGRFNEIFLYQRGGNDLQLSVMVEGAGTLSGNAGMNCSNLCDYNFPLGLDLALVATPDPGMILDGWEVEFGGCEENSNPCNLIMDRSKTITVRFIDPSDLIFESNFDSNP